MDEDLGVVQIIGHNRARLQHRLNHALYQGEIEIIVDFNFNGYPHVLTLANDFVRAAIRLIRNEFDENFGIHGLGRNTFIIGSTLTATVVDYDVFDYGEREHEEFDDDYEDGEEDDDYEDGEEDGNNEDDDRPDPQSRD
jgi:hypothetical protein